MLISHSESNKFYLVVILIVAIASSRRTNHNNISSYFVDIDTIFKIYFVN